MTESVNETDQWKWELGRWVQVQQLTLSARIVITHWHSFHHSCVESRGWVKLQMESMSLVSIFQYNFYVENGIYNNAEQSSQGVCS